MEENYLKEAMFSNNHEKYFYTIVISNGEVLYRTPLPKLQTEGVKMVLFVQEDLI